MQRRSFLKVLLGGVALPLVDNIAVTLSTPEVIPEPWKVAPPSLMDGVLATVLPLITHLKVHADVNWLPNPRDHTFKLPPHDDLVPGGRITLARNLTFIAEEPFTIYGLSLLDDQGAWHVRTPSSELVMNRAGGGPIHLITGDEFNLVQVTLQAGFT